jgi:hypothetical protein
MPFKPDFGPRNGDDLAQQLADELAFSGEHLALGILGGASEVNAGRAGRGKPGSLPARIRVSGSGLGRSVRWPSPAASSKAWCEINSANGLKQRQNKSCEVRRMNYFTMRVTGQVSCVQNNITIC